MRSYLERMTEFSFRGRIYLSEPIFNKKETLVESWIIEDFAELKPVCSFGELEQKKIFQHVIIVLNKLFSLNANKVTSNEFELIFSVPNYSSILTDGENIVLVDWAHKSREDLASSENLLQLSKRKVCEIEAETQRRVEREQRWLGLLEKRNSIKESTASPAGVAEKEASKRVAQHNGGQGVFSITLMWSNDSDLDLHVHCPSGECIYFGNPEVGGGALDIDMNANVINSIDPVENVFWANQPVSGKYIVKVNNFQSRSAKKAQTSFVVIVKIEGRVRKFNGKVWPNRTVEVDQFIVN